MKQTKYTPIYSNNYGMFFLPYDEAMFDTQTAALKYGKKNRAAIQAKGRFTFIGLALPLHPGDEYPHFPVEQRDKHGNEVEPLMVAAISGAIREALDKSKAEDVKIVQAATSPKEAKNDDNDSDSTPTERPIRDAATVNG